MSSFSTSVRLCILLSLLVSARVLAQTPAAPADYAGADHAHDLPQNDPSIGKPIPLRKSKGQFGIMAKRTVVRTLEKLTPNPTAGHDKVTYDKLLQKDLMAFNILNLHKERYVPQLENGPALVNADHEFEGITDRRYGLCWGFSTFVRYFTTLAFFDPNSTDGIPNDPNSKEWMKFYKKKIDQVANGEATLIPGFKNFRELSLVPELELHMKKITMRLWADRAVHGKSIAIMAKATKIMDFAQVENLLRDLETRLARGEMPKIIFSSLIPSSKILGMNTDIHVVLVYGVERGPNQTAKILLWDINYYAETLVREPKFLEITNTHGILYQPWFEENKPYAKGSDLVARVSIAPENDQETADMIQSLKKFCKADATAKYCGNRAHRGAAGKW